MNQTSDDPMLNNKEFLNLQNHDDTDAISSVYVGEVHVV